MDSKLMDRRDHSSAIAKVALFLVFAIGIGIIFAGASGLRSYEGSGFSSESAFQAIYALSAAVESDWNQEISPHLESFTAEQRAALEEQVYNLLRDAWEGQKKNSGEELDTILEQQEENRREELIYKLLYITYQTGGPKVSSATKKALAAVPVGEKKDVQKSLLDALLDGTAPIPAVAESAVEKLEGAERYATLMQLFFTGIGENGRLKTEDINTLKKGVRDKGMQLSAFRMIALEEVSGVRQFVISHSRTVILAGILIALDALLLAFLMAAGRSWHFDMKWIIILVIVDFLLLFQLMPLVYMVIKAFFPDSTFSYETFKRLYTYSLNLDALRNTSIAALSTMVVGTLLAFPLAWLIGRTNLYGRKFFRSLCRFHHKRLR